MQLTVVSILKQERDKIKQKRGLLQYLSCLNFRKVIIIQMQKPKLAFSSLFLILLVCTRQMGWQGYGNMSSSNVSTIMGFINSNIRTYSGTSNYDAFNNAFSGQLNALWDPAWNVFTIVTIASSDAVLYGYAFRNHWMWFNGYSVDAIVLSFVIWKDYNCYGWKTVGKNGAISSFTTGQKNKIYSFIGNNYAEPTNIWFSSRKFMIEKIEEQAVFDAANHAYSMILSQDSQSTVFYGKICEVGNNHYYTKTDGDLSFGSDRSNNNWGVLFLFQTR